MKYLLMFDRDSGAREDWNPFYMDGYELFDTRDEAEARGKRIAEATKDLIYPWNYLVQPVEASSGELPEIVRSAILIEKNEEDV